VAKAKFAPRPPSVAHPDELKATEAAARKANRKAEKKAKKVGPESEKKEPVGKDRFAPRPPSMAHPDDTDLEVAVPVKGKKKKGIHRRLGDKVHKQVYKKHACERAFMCAVAVSLLWMTSLVVAQELVQAFIPTPATSEVISAAEAMFDATEAQKAAYEDCAIDQAITCRANYESSLQRELSRVGNISSLIEENLEEIKNELINCSSAFSNATNEYEDIALVHGSLVVGGYVTGPPSCPPTDVFENTESDQLKAEEAIREIEDYKGKADAEVAEQQNQLDARVAYDIEYLSNKTNIDFAMLAASLESQLADPEDFINSIDRNISEMLACFSADGNQVPLQGGTPVVCNEASIFGRARVQLDAVNAEYSALYAQAQTYRNQLEEKLARYQNFYDRVEYIFGVINAAPGFNTNWIYLAGSIGFVDPLSSLLSPTLGDLEAYLASQGLDPDTIYQDVQLRLQNMRNSVSGEGSALAFLNAAFTGNTTYLAQQIFDDYNPPPVDRDTSEYDEESNAVSSEVAATLNAAVGENENAETVVEDFVDTAKRNASEVSGALLEKADPRNWGEVFLYEESVYNTFRNGLQSLNSVARSLDIAYRVIRSLMLIRKYWNISAINTPPADVRTYAGIQAGMFKAKLNIMQRIGKILTNPLFNIMLFLLFAILWGSAFYYTYSPLFNEYVNNCVDRCAFDIANTITCNNLDASFDTAEASSIPKFPVQPADGTMLYRNGYALAEQYAFSDGDYVAQTEVDSLNLEIQLTCRDEQIASIDTLINQDQRLEFYNKRFRGLNPKIDYYRNCVNNADLNANLGGNINERIANASHPQCRASSYVESFNESYIETNFIPLMTAAYDEFIVGDTSASRRFNCSEIETCNFGCSGPNQELLRGNAHDSSCTVEWYFHAELLTVVMVPTIYILTNLSRLIFLRGIVKVYWRHLSGHKFSYLVSCHEDGTVIYPEAVTKKGQTFRKVIVKQLRYAIVRFERDGWILVLFGMALNVPWISILVITSNNLAFNADRECTSAVDCRCIDPSIRAQQEANGDCAYAS